ncbi:MAG: PIN domain-containing protein [Nanoarchaeota archaeon]
MILLDTSFLIAYHNERDQNHTRACALLAEIKKGNYGEIYITDYIFSECATVLAVRIKNKEESIKHSESIKMIPMLNTDEITFEESWEYFKSQNRLLLSFTDCTMLTLMKKNKISHLATFDTDFDKIEGIMLIN